MKQAPTSFASWLDIESLKPNGVICSKDNLGFVLSLTPLHGEMLTADELWQLHQSLRSLSELEAGDEIKVLYQKRSDLLPFFKSRIEEANKIQGSWNREIYREIIFANLENKSSETPLIFTTRLSLAFSKNFRKENREAIENAVLEKRAMLLDRLEAIGFSPKTLNADELLNELSLSARGYRKAEVPEGQPEWPSIQINSNELVVDDDLVRTLHLNQLPEDFSEMGMIQQLSLLPFPLVIALRIRFENSQPLREKLEKKKQVLFSLDRKKSTSDPALEGRITEIQDVLGRLHDQNDSLVTTTLTIGLRAPREIPDLLSRFIRKIFQAESKLGHLEFREFRFLTFDGFLELQPWGRGKNLPEHTMLLSNAIHFLPVFSHHPGFDRPIVSFYTRSSMPYSLDPVSPTLANYNWLVSGTSGAGKSFFVNSLLSQSLPINPKIFIVDIGGSYKKLARLMNGRVYDFKLADSFKLGPLFIPPQMDPLEQRRRQEQICMIFAEMCRDEERPLNIEEKALLFDKVSEVIRSHIRPDHPIKLIQQRIRESADPAAKRVALLLERWTHPSFFGEFLDTSEVLHMDEDFFYFDLKGIEEFPDLSRVIQFIVCSSIWHHIRQKNNRFSFIVLDEVAFSLLRYQPQFVDELVSTLRKYHAGVILVVQDLEKITTNPAGASILQNTQFKAILQQRGDAKNYREPLGLDELSIKAIQSLERRKGSFSDIFLMNDHSRVILRYIPSRFEYRLATSDAIENELISQQLSQHSDQTFGEAFLHSLNQEATQ
jgi:conjugal transfer ATP-binding protein TraC